MADKGFGRATRLPASIRGAMPTARINVVCSPFGRAARKVINIRYADPRSTENRPGGRTHCA